MRTLPIELGLVIVVATHVMMLNELMPPEVQRNHALLNLAAAGAIAYGLFL
jgi:hypothetical protein